VHGKFDTEMTPKGPDLEVCGPINWPGEAGDEPAGAIEVVAVVVIQPLPALVVAFATPRLSLINHEDEWEVIVTLSDGAWATGLAMALAVVRVTPEGGDEPRFNYERWNETIHLTV
jgi:hypothetical protein